MLICFAHACTLLSAVDIVGKNAHVCLPGTPSITGRADHSVKRQNHTRLEGGEAIMSRLRAKVYVNVRVRADGPTKVGLYSVHAPRLALMIAESLHDCFAYL